LPGTNALTWDAYLCRASDIDDDGWLILQPDTYGQKGSAYHDYAGPLGFIARPLDPEVDADGHVVAGCMMLSAWEGGKQYLIPLADSRIVPNLPAVQKGESIMYGFASNFVRCHLDGSVSIFCTSLGATPGGQTIQWKSSPTGRLYSAPWGKETFDNTGYHLRAFSGARLDLGGVAGMPAPLDALGSYANLQAAAIRLTATLTSIGPAGVPADAVAKATPTLIALQTILPVLNLLATPAVSFVAPPGGGPCTPTPALIAAIATAVATLTGSTAAVPSNSCTVT